MFGCTPISTKKHSENTTSKKTGTYDKIVMPPELKDFNIAFDSVTDFQYLMHFKDDFMVLFKKCDSILHANKLEIFDSLTPVPIKEDF